MAVRAGALNLFRKNSLAEQKRDVLKAMTEADVLSLSEFHSNGLLRWARENGFGVVGSKGDTAIIYDKSKVRLRRKGNEKLNDLEGPTGGMRSRHAAYALFEDRETGQAFWQIAAHTTPPRQGPKRLRERIRREQYESLSNLAERLNGQDGAQVFLAGDLNFRNPDIGGFDTAAGRKGIMKVMALDGTRVRDTERIADRKLRSDHSAVFATFPDLDEPGYVAFDQDDDGGFVPREPKKRGKRGNRGGRGPGAGQGKDRLSPAEIEREYGFAYQFFKSDQELWKLLNNAINRGWGITRFQAELKDTKWYKKHSDVWRQTTALKHSDPQTYQERWKNTQDQIENLAGQWGAQLTDKELRRYTDRALLFGWSPDQILDHIAKEIRPGKSGVFGGQSAGISDQLKETALANGIRVGDNQLQKWVRQIVRGNSDVSEYEQYIRKLAAKTFTAYGKEIEAGVDVIELAAPYVQSMADILELNPGSISMFDKSIRQAMSATNEKGEPTAMSLSTFEDMLRSDPRWKFTDGARNQMRGYAVALGKSFGVLG